MSPRYALARHGGLIPLAATLSAQIVTAGCDVVTRYVGSQTENYYTALFPKDLQCGLV